MQALMPGTLLALPSIHPRPGARHKRRPCFPSASTGSSLGMLLPSYGRKLIDAAVQPMLLQYVHHRVVN